ncbi:MAG TPA: hypothetical protein VKR26_14635, partial [Terriglobales bacterium]|nr:hypothetical protein [Terriglobales bacterium]
GWGMAERFRQEQVLAGDLIDVAYTLEHNDHPEFGGLELRVCDIARAGSAAASATHSGTL